MTDLKDQPKVPPVKAEDRPSTDKELAAALSLDQVFKQVLVKHAALLERLSKS